MNPYSENDVVRMKESIPAKIIGESTLVTIPAQSIGTVVSVYGELERPLAYEVEFYVAEMDTYALATVEAFKIQ